MIIRHAEKQPDDPPPYGIDENGIQNKHSLIVRGWLRAGALIEFFASPRGALVRPNALYAAAASADPAADDEHKSLRPQQTIAPLARKLGLTADTSYGIGREPELAMAITARSGAVLVAWEHTHIPLIAAALHADAPRTWPGERFDVVWLLRHREGGYRFTQIDQSLLSGDAPND